MRDRRSRGTPACRDDAESGFSLVELLVAAALTALLAGGVLAITATVVGHWHRETGTVARGVQAEAALDLLALDLAGALIDVPAEYRVVVEKGTGDPGPEGVSLRFVSGSAGPATDAGSVRAVAWYTTVDDDRESPFVDDYVPALFRAVIEPGETWRMMRAGDALPPVSSYLTNSADGLFLSHCIGFEVRLWGRRVDGSIFLARKVGTRSPRGESYAIPHPLAPGEAWWEIAYLDVTIDMLPDEAVDVLQRQRRGEGERRNFDEAEWLQTQSVRFSRRISLRTTP